MPSYDYVGTVTQAGRLLAIETPIGPDVFLLEGMDGAEELCGLFSFRPAVRSKRQDVTPAEMVGLPISWTLELPGGARREWSGVVGALEAGPTLGDGMRAYTPHRPSLALAVRAHLRLPHLPAQDDAADPRDRSSRRRRSATMISGRVIGAKALREYCVQYNEIDLDFIFRLLEEEGWARWFRHEPGEERGRQGSTCWWSRTGLMPGRRATSRRSATPRPISI